MTGRVDSVLPIIQIYLYMALQDKHDTKMIIYMNQITNNMEYIIRRSQEIIWCNDDDRYILLIKEDNEVIGLNYMQGDELEVFKSEYNDIDEELTDFYNATRVYLGGFSELERINQAIWAYFEFKVAKYERKAL